MDRNDERAGTAAATAAVAGNGRERDAKRTWSKPTLHKLPLRDARLGSFPVGSDGIIYS